MAGETITIRELTGSQRSVELLDRAMPYRPASWQRHHVIKKTRYSGNPVATIQMLGPEYMPLEINGEWKARYIAEAASITGFDDIWTEGNNITPEILVAVFDRILDGGNLLEVSWANEIRRGVLVDFNASYQRVEDIAWKLKFEWTQKGDFTAPRATPVADQQSEIDTSLSDLEDGLSQIPSFILPNITAAIILQEVVVREAMLSLSSGMAAIYGIPQVTNSEFQSIASFADEAASAARALGALTLDTSIEDLIASDDVNSLLLGQTWAMEMGQRSLAVGVVAISSRESIRSRVVADMLDRVRVGRNQTLRSIALEFYGSADSWTTIADANGLTGSNPPIGTQVWIPRRRDTGA